MEAHGRRHDAQLFADHTGRQAFFAGLNQQAERREAMLLREGPRALMTARASITLHDSIKIEI
jgi:hypothetical protein